MLEPLQPIAPDNRRFRFKISEKSSKLGLPWPCSGFLQHSQTQQLSSRGAASLCEVCKGITLSALESPDGYTYTGKALERSASLLNACRLCNPILNTLKHAYFRMVQDVNLDIKMSDYQAEQAFSKILNANNQCVTLFAFADSDIALIPKPPFLESEQGFPPVLTLYNPSGSPSTGLTEYFVPCSTTIEAVALGAHWLSECFATHPKCPKTIESPLPKRLVDVGYLGDADDPVRLWLNPWTFQERLLSTRYFTFGPDGMFWECSQGRKYDNAYLWHSYEDLSPKLPEPPTFQDWHHLIQEYSGKQLTKSEDRLMALAGLRTHFLRLRKAQDTDLAGLWRSNLSWDLLWESSRFGCNNDPISMAPSWSWASTHCIASWTIAHCYEEKHICHSECVSIQDATTKTVSVGPTSKIEGRIKLNGFVSRAKPITSGLRNRNTLVVVDELGNTVYAQFDDESSYSTKLYSSPEAEIITSNIFCVQFHSNPGCIGLLVESTGEACTEFRRVGIYRTRDPMISRPSKPVVLVIV